MCTSVKAAVEPQKEMEQDANLHGEDLPEALSRPSAEELEVARELVRSARARGTALTGPGGLLKALTKTVIETALDEEMADHLGYDRHDPAGQNTGNSRNGSRTKTVLTDNCGPVEIEVPRDRNGSFDPGKAPTGRPHRRRTPAGEPWYSPGSQLGCSGCAGSSRLPTRTTPSSRPATARGTRSPTSSGGGGRSERTPALSG